MKKMTASVLLFSILLFFCIPFSHAQNLSFTKPANFLPDAKTDKSFDITYFKGSHFVTWKEPGIFGRIHVSCLGKKYDTSFSEQRRVIKDGESAFGPVIRTTNDHAYVL
ncbi:MAG: hypothetical protein ABUT20_58315, partial [Bacteroidota bacterium]